MSQELKTCPFCGGEAELDNAAEPQFPRRPTVSCKDEHCFGYMPSAYFARDADAIAAWNTRASDTRIAELEAEVERLRVRLDAMLGLLDAAKTVLEWMNQLPIPTEGCTAKGMLLHQAISRVQP